MHVLEHVPNYKAVLKEIYRVLNPKGLFVIAVPTERIRGDLALGGIIFTGKNGHLHKFNYYQMCKDIKHEGFEIEDAYLCIGFPFIAVNFKKIRFPLIASFFSYSMVFSCRKK